MPEPADNPREPAAESDDESVESLDGELVAADDQRLAEVQRLSIAQDDERSQLARRRVALPAAVAAATGGFALGVAAFLVLKVLGRPSAARRLAHGSSRLLGRRKGLEVQGSRSFLVDVHMLKR